jgi:hypothetical protein
LGLRQGEHPQDEGGQDEIAAVHVRNSSRSEGALVSPSHDGELHPVTA